MVISGPLLGVAVTGLGGLVWLRNKVRAVQRRCAELRAAVPELELEQRDYLTVGVQVSRALERVVPALEPLGYPGMRPTIHLFGSWRGGGIVFGDLVPLSGDGEGHLAAVVTVQGALTAETVTEVVASAPAGFDVFQRSVFVIVIAPDADPATMVSLRSVLDEVFARAAVHGCRPAPAHELLERLRRVPKDWRGLLGCARHDLLAAAI